MGHKRADEDQYLMDDPCQHAPASPTQNLAAACAAAAAAAVLMLAGVSGVSGCATPVVTYPTR